MASTETRPARHGGVVEVTVAPPANTREDADRALVGTPLPAGYAYAAEGDALTAALMSAAQTLPGTRALEDPPTFLFQYRPGAVTLASLVSLGGERYGQARPDSGQFAVA
jgi:hypothetical protein